MLLVRRWYNGGACILIYLTMTLGTVVAAGRFEGPIIVEFLSNGRDVKVYKTFNYIDSDGRRWVVPEGTESDGASIPQIFWSLIGGPFEDKYRDASIVHDLYCVKKTRKWQDVHKVFYDAMQARGVSPKKAWLMYMAVEEFGPRWDEPKVDPNCIKPDGKFDFDKCTENSAVLSIAPTIHPEITRRRLLDFADQVQAEADPADVQKVRAKANSM
jgi:hypothetical protein